MEQVRRENPLIFSRGVAITRKLGFPDVIMPGESTHSGPVAEPSSPGAETGSGGTFIKNNQVLLW